MNLATKEIKVAGEILTLTNQRVAYWEREQALILSDLHVGKTAHFRKNGIALPKNVLQSDLERLESVIEHFQPKQITVVGDLLHAGGNSEVDYFCDWRLKYREIDFHLIQGNHDRISRQLEEKLCLTTKENELQAGPFLFVHDFVEAMEAFQITGHIHPGILIRHSVRNIKLPCFALTQNQLLLPAFSEFTGLDINNLPKRARYFPFTSQEIYEL